MTTNNTRRAWLLVRLTALALAVTACGPALTPTAPTPTEPSPIRAIPTPTSLAIGGAEQSSPLEESVALVRAAQDGPVAGAAVILTEDGFLLTTGRVLSGSVEVVLPDGSVVRPIRVAHDEDTDLALIKVFGADLTPVRLATGRPAAGESVFAAGYDAARASFGQIGGRLRAGSGAQASTALLETDIALLPGFDGGALVEQGGALLGLITTEPDDADARTLRAVPVDAVLTWLDAWRATMADVVADDHVWPVLEVPGGLEVQYPTGWHVLREGGDVDDYRAEIAPDDPDAALTLAISVEPAPAGTDPLAFAAEQFDGRKDAVIWGAVTYAGIPGVRVHLVQEGARVDMVYLFHEGRQIALGLTSGYGSDNGEQAARATALFEAVLRSIVVA